MKRRKGLSQKEIARRRRQREDSYPIVNFGTFGHIDYNTDMRRISWSPDTRSWMDEHNHMDTSSMCSNTFREIFGK